MTHAHTTIATDLIRCPRKLQTALDKVLAADWDGTVVILGSCPLVDG